MHEPSFADFVLVAVELEGRRAAMYEVQLVLFVVVVSGAVVVGREDERIDAECGDAERLADLAKAVALAELIE